MKNGSDLKSRVINTFLEHKQQEFDGMKKLQEAEVSGAIKEGKEVNNNTESLKEEMLDEVEQRAKALDFLANQILYLKEIDRSIEHEAAVPGSLVQTNSSWFLIGVAHQKEEIEGENFFGVSKQSPIYEKMEGLQSGQSFSMNGNDFNIISIS